ncbi:MAG TPA: xanthine dehydrogenase family protein subunit M, partial [Xanthobacteraceae bacterium]|nr:xanthine dehydrogenase family protein subunit M [Xanthobacteraceae bacterium]
RRSGDFALAAVAVTLTVTGGKIAQARIAMTGVAPTARRVTEAEKLLVGRRLDDGVGSDVIDAVRAASEPPTDLHASSDYRRHLIGVLATRAIAAAWGRT